jgi:hypothetical protein
MGQVGRVVGFALLGLVDAVVPAAVLVGTVLLFGPVATWTVTVAAVLGLLGVAVGALLGAVAASRGGRPFPLSRGAIRLWRRVVTLPFP